MLIESIVATLADLPPAWLYLVLGVGAAVENFVPPIPADTFVLFGAFLATQGHASVFGVFLSTWAWNFSGSLSVYLLARRYGRGFFTTRPGRFLLRPRQLAKLETLYATHGAKIIFLSRFVPGFRALVPAFAGAARLGPGRTLLAVALASGLWYTALIVLGTALGENWDRVLRTFGSINRTLALVAVVLVLATLWLWWRSRRHGEA